MAEVIVGEGFVSCCVSAPIGLPSLTTDCNLELHKGSIGRRQIRRRRLTELSFDVEGKLTTWSAHTLI